MSSQIQILVFFFITMLGSALSGIASFLSIESYFHALIFLGFALSARTFASAILSYAANDIVSRFGIKNCLLGSQIFGFLSLLVLYMGFSQSNFPLTVLGIVLVGLPATMVAILTTIILKVTSAEAHVFRRYSIYRELLFGVAMLLSSALVPLLLLKLNLNWVLFFDVVSYIIGFLLIRNFVVDKQLTEDRQEEKISLVKVVKSSLEVKTFLLKTGASLLLAGLVPLMASSSNIEFTMNMPLLMREWLWSVKDITAISASVIYLFFVFSRTNRLMDSILMLGGIWFIIPAIFSADVSVILATFIISFLIDFSGQKFRDDLIISAGNNKMLINAYSSIAQFQRNFIFFLSPILITLLLTYAGSYICIALITIVQLVLLMMVQLAHSTQTDTVSTLEAEAKA